MEFWATWCGPCVGSIPHLNALWQKFKGKGVIVIGQDMADNDEAVEPFVKKMGTNMTYRVALDDKSGNTKGMMETTWMKAAEQSGIPTAFIINKNGIIVWIGHPMTLTEQVMNDIISGHYDLTKATVDYKRQHEADIKFQALQEKLFKALDQRKWAEAQSTLNEITNTFPRAQNGFTGQRLEILLGQQKFDEAYQFAESFSTAHARDAGWQNSLAWDIATSEGPNAHCLGLAEKIAERGVQLTNGKDSAVLDTLARVQFLLGKKQDAIITEEKALSLESNPHEKSRIEKTLASYRQGELPKAQ